MAPGTNNRIGEAAETRPPPTDAAVGGMRGSPSSPDDSNASKAMLVVPIFFTLFALAVVVGGIVIVSNSCPDVRGKLQRASDKANGVLDRGHMALRVVRGDDPANMAPQKSQNCKYPRQNAKSGAAAKSRGSGDLAARNDGHGSAHLSGVEPRDDFEARGGGHLPRNDSCGSIRSLGSNGSRVTFATKDEVILIPSCKEEGGGEPPAGTSAV